jgi:hypothetical protein
VVCSCFILSFDACIVTITWSLLFVIIALWVICGLLTLVCFLVFYWLMGKHLALLADVVSGFKSFSEAPRPAWKCGTHKSDSPVRALYSTTLRSW